MTRFTASVLAHLIFPFLLKKQQQQCSTGIVHFVYPLKCCTSGLVCGLDERMGNEGGRKDINKTWFILLGVMKPKCPLYNRRGKKKG